MTHRTGRDVLLDVLADEGVRHIFGNPGTTELPLMDALAARPEFEYVLALQENSVVGMADGYAQATRRPAFVNLHTTSGLGGGMGNLTNAQVNRTPLVVTAGQQDRRHLLADPMLSGDLVGMARPVTKWGHEVRDAAELGTTLRRAFKDAATPPTGPVFVSLPMDVLDEQGDFDVPPRSTINRDTIAGGLQECAELLAGVAQEDLVLVVGEEVARSGALDEVRELAETLGCLVYGTPFYAAQVFPTDHPLWRGTLGGHAAGTRKRLTPYQRAFYIGAQVGFGYPYTPGPAVPVHVDLIHLSDDPSLVGRTYPTDLGLIGDIRSTLRALLPLVRDRVDVRALEAHRQDAEKSRSRQEKAARDNYNAVPMDPWSAVHALYEALPPGGAVVDEAVTTSGAVRSLHKSSAPGSYFFGRGGGLGWGMPAALGVKLARPGTPVLCVVGDGAAMYSIQCLWTAAKLDLGVVFAVANNRRYRILHDGLARSGGRSAETGRFVGMDLEPPVDYVALANSMGVGATLVDRASDVVDAARAAFDSGRPHLLELPITASNPH